MRKVLMLSLLVALGLSACEKDEVSYPYSYVCYVVTDGTLRVYTEKGEVHDQDIKERFYNQMQKVISSGAGEDTYGELVITYHNVSDITIDGFGERHDGKAYKKDDVLIWEYPYKLKSYGWAPYSSLWPINYEVLPMPLTSGYSEVIEYNPCIFAKRSNGRVYLPMIQRLVLSYFYSDNQPNVYRTQDNNVYDYSFHDQPEFYMTENDTLVVYEYAIEMKKQ
ncbi:hypothetical protein KDU71_16470 [Carboxylicivirga sediminis]|uniref:DUF4377 domain-containing protein n=1 Tax=Carboxylicivirga sediminis TaxID=2006564 RepID=A0A941IXT2_9BACT|nr:hypothetical protein [Carboxylicivirga sediminis]MBR8537166.1 hypothetical protein [Carboxylicivirga sediminis]